MLPLPTVRPGHSWQFRRRKGARYAGGRTVSVPLERRLPGESFLAAVRGGRMPRNSSTAVGPPQAVRKIDGDDDHQQGQDRIPLTPNSLEL